MHVSRQLIDFHPSHPQNSSFAVFPIQQKIFHKMCDTLHRQPVHIEHPQSRQCNRQHNLSHSGHNTLLPGSLHQDPTSKPLNMPQNHRSEETTCKIALRRPSVPQESLHHHHQLSHQPSLQQISIFQPIYQPNSAPEQHECVSQESTSMEHNTQIKTSMSEKALSQKSAEEHLFGEDPTIWVFGYGSLLWKTDFPYRSKQIGYIEGYARRFYQGNETFRGRPGQPGRVANLIEEEHEKTWGVAFEIHGQEEVAKVLKSLYKREAVSGGYTTMVTTFYPRKCRKGKDTHNTRNNLSSLTRETSSDCLSSLSSTEDELSEYSPHTSTVKGGDLQSNPNRSHLAAAQLALNPEHKHVQVLLYTASSDNGLYLGPDSFDVMAQQIVNAKGTAGTNVEYVTKTADFVRSFIPEDLDDHLFQLDRKVRELLHAAHARNSMHVPPVATSNTSFDVKGVEYTHTISSVQVS